MVLTEFVGSCVVEGTSARSDRPVAPSQSMSHCHCRADASYSVVVMARSCVYQQEMIAMVAVFDVVVGGDLITSDEVLDIILSGLPALSAVHTQAPFLEQIIKFSHLRKGKYILYVGSVTLPRCFFFMKV